MTPEFERELRLMGVMPSALDAQEDEPSEVDPRAICLTKGYFNDPRDPVTGEVNH
mgnify:CR=1 FL=1